MKGAPTETRQPLLKGSPLYKPKGALDWAKAMFQFGTWGSVPRRVHLVSPPHVWVWQIVMDATSGLPRADYAAGLAARNCRTLLLTVLVRPHNLANTPLYQTCSATLPTHEESRALKKTPPFKGLPSDACVDRAHSFLMCLGIPRGNFRCWPVSPIREPTQRSWIPPPG